MSRPVPKRSVAENESSLGFWGQIYIYVWLKRPEFQICPQNNHGYFGYILLKSCFEFLVDHFALTFYFNWLLFSSKEGEKKKGNNEDAEAPK